MRCLRPFLFILLSCFAMASHGRVEFSQLQPLESGDLKMLLANSLQSDHGRIHTALGTAYLDKNIELADEHYAKANVLLATDDLAGQAVQAASYCVRNMVRGDMAAALEICKRGVELGVLSLDPIAEAKARSALGQIYYQSGRLSEAVDETRKALIAAEQSGDAATLAAQYNNLGLQVQAQGLYRPAIEYFRRGLDLLSTLVNEPLYYFLSFNLGVTYADLGQHELAKDFYRPAMLWSREEARYRRELVAIVYTALSDVALGLSQQAESDLQAALTRPALMANKGYIGFVYAALGRAQYAQNKLTDALVSYENGLAISATIQNTFEQRRIDIGYAQVLSEVGRVAEAELRMQKVLGRLQVEGSGHLYYEALETMLQIMRAKGDIEGSLAIFEQLTEMQGRVRLDDLEHELAFARAAYEVDTKERELVAAERDAIVRNGTIMLLLAVVVIGYLYITRRMEVQRRQVQGELARRLEEEVDARTSELRERMVQIENAESARRDMEKQLAEADKLRVLGQLTGGVAHDFNNLLTVVIGAAELLKVGVDESKRDDLLEHIITAAGSGAGITRALMAYARKQPMLLESIELGAFLKIRVPLISRTMGGTVTLALSVPEKEVYSRLDPAQLTAAVLNLALNARDAQSNQGEIKIQLARRDQKYIEISVSDNGVGMSVDELAHVVEPFYTTKKDNQGNGLGLSMVDGFSKQSGGDLEIESAADHGTTVRLVLPSSDATESSEVSAIEVDALQFSSREDNAANENGADDKAAV
jgi:signal transduction histidine kinase/Tfp pilus assembly protein PilF